VTCACFDKRFDGGSIAELRINSLAEVKEALEWPVAVALGGDGLGGARSTGFDRPQAEQNLTVFHGEIGIAAVDTGRQDLNSHPLAVLEVLNERVFALKVSPRNITR